MTSSYIDASHNVLRTLNHDKWMKDFAVSAAADLTGYQEATNSEVRATLREFCIAHNRAYYHPAGCGNPISWKKDVFGYATIDRKPMRGVIDAHLGALAMGINAKYNPGRDFTYVGLTHKPTGKKVLRINVHATSGATREESSPLNKDSDALSKWKDWSIGQYWLDVISFLAGQMSEQDPGIQTTTNLWDIITVGGDYNATLRNFRRWYYPAPMLEGLLVPDQRTAGIDHLQHAFGSDVQVRRRWTEPGLTDHPIHFVERAIVPITDFLRDI